eukprot:gene24201-4068_t
MRRLLVIGHHLKASQWQLSSRSPRGHVLKQGSGDDDDGSSRSGDIRVSLYSGVEVAVAD